MFLAFIGGLHEDKSYATLYKQYYRGKRFIKPPYFIPRATSMDLEWCGLPTASVLSNKMWTNHALASFDQQAQVSQGHSSCRNKENCDAEVHADQGLQLVKPAREPASSRPKPCASLQKRHRNVARSPLHVHSLWETKTTVKNKNEKNPWRKFYKCRVMGRKNGNSAL